MKLEHRYLIIGCMVFSAVLIVLVGCVPLTTHRVKIKEAKIATMQKDRKIAYYQRCQEVVDILSSRIDVEERQ